MRTVDAGFPRHEPCRPPEAHPRRLPHRGRGASGRLRPQSRCVVARHRNHTRGTARSAHVGDTARGDGGCQEIDGTPFSADVLAGRPVVLWFWAPWCFVCRSEAPNVNIAVHHEAGLATFVGVAGLGQEGDMRSFVRSTHTEGIVHLADTTGSIWNAFGIVAQPSFAFITADRRVSTYTGSLGASNLIDKVDALLGA